MKVLVTGASGLSRRARRRARSRRAATACGPSCARRRTRKHLEKLPNVELFEGSVEQVERVREAVDGVDAIVHCAGIVKARSDRRVLRGQRRRHVEPGRGGAQARQAAASASSTSRASRRAGPRDDGEPVPVDQENPVTAYGRSKLAAEKVVLSAKDDMPVVILRPGAIYGPRDVEILELFKSIQRGLFPVVDGGRSQGRLDLRDRLRRGLPARHRRRRAERAASTSSTTAAAPSTQHQMFADAERALGKQARPREPARCRVSWRVARGVEVFGRLDATAPSCSRARRPACSCMDWVCSSEATRKELGWEPKVPVERGRRTSAVAWYRDNGWL